MSSHKRENEMNLSVDIRSEVLRNGKLQTPRPNHSTGKGEYVHTEMELTRLGHRVCKDKKTNVNVPLSCPDNIRKP
jgi:hypothetical protein